MCKEIRGNHSHLTLDDRFNIEKLLEQGVSFKQIAISVHKDPSTISKEIKRNRIRKERKTQLVEVCLHKKDCSRKNVCNYSPACNRKCSTCDNCTKNCESFSPKKCNKVSRAPFVCNGCDLKNTCKLNRFLYKAKVAQDKYSQALSESRKGINLCEYELFEIDEMVSPLIQKGQSIAHIYSTHKDDLPISSRTLYNYVDNCLITARNLDLPRKVRYKPRRKHSTKQRNHVWLEGRNYLDFEAFTKENPEMPVVEIDIVEGKKGGKVLLTIYFRDSKFMLAFLMEKKTQEAVRSIFDYLEELLTTPVFQKIFFVTLTDNGSEFINPTLLEIGINSEIRTKVFYCDPYSSYQKGGIEKNHEYIRCILPKGTSFNHLTQEAVTLMMNHINSAARKSLENQAPFTLFPLLLEEQAIQALGLKIIKPDEVCLKPFLLKDYK